MNKTSLINENTISILGCGWLGIPLAEHFISKKIKIKGSTTSKFNFSNLVSIGITPFYINLNPNINSDFEKEFFKTDVLIINFPPKLRESSIEWHSLQIKSLINEIKKARIQKVVFISSTSVYADINNDVDEFNTEEPSTNSGIALRIAENLFLKETIFKTTIIRFGGLIGYDRNPGRFFAGKKQINNGLAPVNLIHRDDCIGVISHIIDCDIWGEILNACSPQHPTKKDFYTIAAKSGNFKIPEFISNLDNYKRISSNKLINQFKYSFKYINPLDIFCVF